MEMYMDQNLKHLQKFKMCEKKSKDLSGYHLASIKIGQGILNALFAPPSWLKIPITLKI